ncbi:MAG: hypothetical protein CM15mP74_22390 [Halieaceae bacterium]|nr:MAG: hypothetical protein CM15mP74_22390 [Halieaceae bacterium]
MKELGLFGATISEEFGGLGLSASTYSRIVSRICEVWMAPLGILILISSWPAAWSVLALKRKRALPTAIRDRGVAWRYWSDGTRRRIRPAGHPVSGQKGR